MSNIETINMTPMISVIIASYNRFSLLKSAVQSVLEQTYKNYEIIIVNDASTDINYYNNRGGSFLQINNYNCNIIHLQKNSREQFGFPCAGYVRNIGVNNASGTYLAFLDDDDIWLPDKLQLQMDAIMKEKKNNGIIIGMSCTEGYIGFNPWNYLLPAPDSNCGLQLYNKEYYFDTLCNIYNASRGETTINLRRDGFPTIWNDEMMKIHNCVITSSVIMSRKLFKELGGFRELKNGEEDYDLWKRATENGEKIVYINEPCFYYFLRR